MLGIESKLIEAAIKEKIKNKALSPDEKLIKSSKNKIKPVVKASENIIDSVKAEKAAEINAAKNYFKGINDTEKLKALEGTNELKKAEALMEAREKSAKSLDNSNKIFDGIKVDKRLNPEKDVSFGHMKRDGIMRPTSRLGCQAGGILPGR